MKTNAAVKPITCTRAILANSATNGKAPTPQQIDERAAEYQRLQEWIEAGKLDAKRLKDALVKLARKYGEVPAGAEKSLRLLGELWQITASFGTSSSIDEEVVEQIRIELALAGLPGTVFRQLFRLRTSHVVAPTAQAAIEKLPKKAKKLFALVMTTSPKEPSLKVEKRKR